MLGKVLTIVLFPALSFSLYCTILSSTTVISMNGVLFELNLEGFTFA